MTTTNIIAGLQLLDGYRDKPGSYDVGADHDVIYAYATDKPLSESHVKKMIALGWFQEGKTVATGEMPVSDYDASECWMAFT